MTVELELIYSFTMNMYDGMQRISHAIPTAKSISTDDKKNKLESASTSTTAASVTVKEHDMSDKIESDKICAEYEENSQLSQLTNIVRDVTLASTQEDLTLSDQSRVMEKGHGDNDMIQASIEKSQQDSTPNAEQQFITQDDESYDSIDDSDQYEDFESFEHDIKGENHVTFEEQLQQQEAPPNFTEEDFPALVSTELVEERSHTNPAGKNQENAPQSSWSQKISSDVLQPGNEQSFKQKKTPENRVIASTTTADSLHDVEESIAEEYKDNSLKSDAVNMESFELHNHGETAPSRILSSGVGSGYVNTEWNVRQSNEDDGVGWINPTNLETCKNSGLNMINSQAADNCDADFVLASGKKKRNKKNKKKENESVKHDQRPCNVACVTTDYAMQNVMVQMGLQVLSIDCRLIKQVKQWVLRCGACYQVHYDMDRLFCSRCGANMMQRISASTDSRTGELRLHLKKNYHYNTRGLVHSLPKAGKQKKYDGELLLREDQLLSGIWRQKVVKVRKDVRSAFGEDVTSDVGLHINKGAPIKVGLGRRNPNADKGRERRGKKKKK